MGNDQATINVRINASLKDRGDRILHANGLSTSEAIRSLWNYLARAKTLPSFMTEEFQAQADDARKRKRKALGEFAGIAKRGASLTDEELDALRLRSMLKDYQELS